MSNKMITLKTLEQATAQQVYNHVATHLLTQNAKSIEGYVCMYHTSQGLKCAAGCLIGNDEYSINMENTSWPDLDGIPVAHTQLIQNLQNVHDCSSVANWPDQLRKVAGWHNLNADVISQ